MTKAKKKWYKTYRDDKKLNISEIIKIFENKELRSLFTTDEQEKMLTIIRKETIKYIDNQINKTDLDYGYETSSYKSEVSSFTMK